MNASVEAEKALVGALLLAPSELPSVSGVVRPADFADPASRAAYGAMLVLHAESKPLDVQLLFGELCRQQLDKTVGGVSGLSALVDAATTGENAKYYAQEVSKESRNRRMVAAVENAYRAVQGGDIPNACNELVQNLSRLSGNVGKIEFENAGDWLQEHIPAMPAIIAGLMDVGDKCFVIGGPKTRKSFFVMQLALCLATGEEFLGFRVPRLNRVAVCQMEIQPHHYHNRLVRLANAKAIDAALLKDRLFIANLRGVKVDVDTLAASMHRFRPDLVVLDPLYKLYAEGHDENSAGDAATLLAKFDRLTKSLACGLIVVHHDNKRATGDTKSTSRGSGSSAVARDYDAALLLTAHATEPEAMVLETIVRNHPPRDPVTIAWDVNRFVIASTIPPTPETLLTKTARIKQGPSMDEVLDSAEKWIANSGGRVLSIELHEHLRRRFTFGRNRTNEVIQLLEVRRGYIRKPEIGSKKWYVSTPEEKPSLPELPSLPGM